MDDSRIIELYFSRDPAAIRETAAKYGLLSYSISNRILSCPEDAEECVNDTYLSLWNSIPPEKPGDLCAYIGKIVRNISLNLLRKRNAAKRQAVTVSFDELENILPDSQISESLSDENIGKHISEFLLGEKEEHRNIFIRKYFYLDSVEDIAERYTLTNSNVKVILHRMRNRLKKHLEKEGIKT